MPGPDGRTCRCHCSDTRPELSTLTRQIGGRAEEACPRRRRLLFIDDLNGCEADGTVRFGLDSTNYEIDLNTKHAQELRDTLARYRGASRRCGSIARRLARHGRSAPINGLNTTEVCEWAKTQGIDVKDRGRVPAELVAKIQGGNRQVGPGTFPVRQRGADLWTTLEKVISDISDTLVRCRFSSLNLLSMD
jgi:hypothetical protein